MSIQKEDKSVSLGLIPPNLRKPEQVARCFDGQELLTYKLLRDPVDFLEFNHYNGPFAIWRDNSTLTFVVPESRFNYTLYEKRLILTFKEKGLTLSIAGKTEKAIAQTAAYFLGLHNATENSSTIYIETQELSFDFRAAGPRCLSNILKGVPSPALDFERLTFSAKQTAAMATVSNPVTLSFSECEFEDGGKAFVDALEKRKSSFGSLSFVNTSPLRNDYMRRLSRLDVINRLELPFLDDSISLLPFSAKLDQLEYDICTSVLSETNVKSLHIVAKKLTLMIKSDTDGPFPIQPAVSMLRRIAELGHFEELKIRFLVFDGDMTMPDCIVTETIKAVLANSNLKVLDLSTDDEELEWESHLEMLFEGIRNHKELRILKVVVGWDAFGPDYSFLRQFISQNRHISVTDEDGKVHSDGKLVDELYSLNRFIRDSATLVAEQSSERPLLVAKALTVLNSFQRTGLLLSNHTDALHELIQKVQNDGNLDRDVDNFSPNLTNPRPKRRRCI
ncbi:hypothetical protein FisN_13Hu172 [Fistulifera solaris]|jgi:hypothetical protein|uniref:Uncharacterized protein n=1 Tax=Fistulifera solaris TaxID=1519565 RepID=A0A1Z5KN15_FISSO|nr:hypothetical protein FisN_13Hu172 [Fistulifera solaris]|eukprot:GAX27730.1 hypothetical protein FisN_13Hu172 [Fistulifera solaris]